MDMKIAEIALAKVAARYGEDVSTVAREIEEAFRCSGNIGSSENGAAEIVASLANLVHSQLSE